MDKDAIEKICELQAEIDGYRRFVMDFLVSIIKREHRTFIVHDETSSGAEIASIWVEYDKLLDDAAVAQSLKEKEQKEK